MERVELLYIDSSHEREQTIEEVTTWLPYLVPGAPVIFDDFNEDPPWPGVSDAIRALGLPGEQHASLFVYRHQTNAEADRADFGSRSDFGGPASGN